MSGSAQSSNAEQVGQLALWFGLLGGALAWIAHLLVSYAVVPIACDAGLVIIQYGTAAVTTVGALAAVLVAGRGWRRTRESAEDERLTIQRSYFLSLAGMILSALFLFVIIMQSLPIFLQSPCEAAGSLRI